MILVIIGFLLCLCVSNILYYKLNIYVFCKWNNYYCDLFRKCYFLNKFCKKYSNFFLFKIDESEWVEGL